MTIANCPNEVKNHMYQRRPARLYLLDETSLLLLTCEHATIKFKRAWIL
jgi:hypothetical protein